MSNSTHLKFFVGKGGKIDPSLNDGYLYATNTTFEAIRERLLVNEAVREDVPSKSALSKQAKKLGVKLKATRKVYLAFGV